MSGCAEAAQDDLGQDLTAAQLEGVASEMARGGAPLVGPLTSRLMTGGRSNLTFELSDGVSRWVLRTPPRAGLTPSAHDVAREHRVTAALGATGVPVAEAVLLCEDDSVLGARFTVSAFVDGAAVRTEADLASYDDRRPTWSSGCSACWRLCTASTPPTSG
jgi:aminoglycoside phosphotransferase (APT) family kinase protein